MIIIGIMLKRVVTISFCIVFIWVSMGIPSDEFPCACCGGKNSRIVPSFPLPLGQASHGGCCDERSSGNEGSSVCCANRPIEGEKPSFLPAQASFSQLSISILLANITPRPFYGAILHGSCPSPIELIKPLYIQNLAFRC
jgi:hypothetical protein